MNSLKIFSVSFDLMMQIAINFRKNNILHKIITINLGVAILLQ